MAIKGNLPSNVAHTLDGGTGKQTNTNSNYELLEAGAPTISNGNEIIKPGMVDSGNKLPEINTGIPFTPTGPTGATGSTGTTSTTYTVASSQPTSPSWETDATELAGYKLLQDEATAEQCQ